MGRALNALVSILGPLNGMAFLDLFSGTGRVAAAARDRGASVVTVELVRERAADIRRKLGDRDHVQLCMDVRRALKWLEKHGMTFDVVFADPPYDSDWMKVLPGLLAEHRALLRQSARVIVERSGSEPLALDGSPWALADERRYGISVFDFLTLKENADVQA